MFKRLRLQDKTENTPELSCCYINFDYIIQRLLINSFINPSLLSSCINSLISSYVHRIPRIHYLHGEIADTAVCLGF